MPTKSYRKAKKAANRRPAFPPRTQPEILGFVCDEHKRAAKEVLRHIAERFHLTEADICDAFNL